MSLYAISSRLCAAVCIAGAATWCESARGQESGGAAGIAPAETGKGATVKPSLKPEPEEHANRLIHETSPYLLQHAYNPVDWYPWGPEAFEKARKEDKPIFLSVGYSSCHWCHVMERESFENDEIAAILNERFVSIKVDREERPDVDEIYMTAVQAMTGSGGWPMSVFLTPDLDPFYGGTYFPPDDRYGRPGFKAVLNHLAKVWQEKRGEIEQGADRLSEHMREILGGVQGQPGNIQPKLIHDATAELLQSFDQAEGGFGQAPKFPSAPSIALLLREYDRARDSALLHAATLTLDRMADGGIYDHLGGGFSRYSTDDRWLVPHFEKMLYDNAQLAQAYLEAYQLTGNDHYHRVVEETLRYVLRDMTDERGGFYSAEDADSEGQEGKFYNWTHDEIVAVLGSEGTDKFAAFYNVKPEGNFRSHEPYHAGQNILHTPRPLAEVAEELGLDPDAYALELAEMKQTLLEVRNKRVRPGLDDKVLVSWNGLMISAFARAAQVLHKEEYRDAATRAADFILDEMMEDGALLHSYRDGVSKLPAYLDDYAFFIVALIDVYEATFDIRYLDAADTLTKTMVEKFWDERHPGFYFTADEHDNLIVRTRPSFDSAIPSGNSLAAYGLLRLAKLLDNEDYYEYARTLLEAHYTHMSQIPRGHLNMLLAADFLLYPPKEIALVGPRDSEGLAMLLQALHGAFIPNKVVAHVDPAAPDAGDIGERVPLVANKGLVNGKPAAYVCLNFACRAPVTTGAELLKELEVDSQ